MIWIWHFVSRPSPVTDITQVPRGTLVESKRYWCNYEVLWQCREGQRLLLSDISEVPDRLCRQRGMKREGSQLS